MTVSSMYTDVEIAYQKVGDGHPLRLWRTVTEVEAPPEDVVDFIKDRRDQWDSSFIEGSVVRKIDDKNDIYCYALKGVKKSAFCVLRCEHNSFLLKISIYQYNFYRSLHTHLTREACIVIETSIDEPGVVFPQRAAKGVVLASRYLIEPCGSGRSKILHFSRVDIK